MMATIAVRLTGVAPLLMRNGRLADPLDEFSIELGRVTTKRQKSLADHRRIADLEYAGGLWTHEGRPCLPAAALESSICQAAARRRAKQAFRSGVAVQENAIIEHDGPETLEGLRADPAFRLRVAVSINGKRLMRTRPRFPKWSAVATIGYLPSVIDRRDLHDVLAVAGDLVGIGDFRPKFGRFSVEVADGPGPIVPAEASHG